MKKVSLEAPVFTAEAAILAETYGVDRIELCSNFEVGGETPSAGSLKYLRAKIGIPIFVMIRPRGGDFFYSPAEIRIMKEDIHLLKDLGADGFVFGALRPEGKLDMDVNSGLIHCAGGLPCTLHRAFDSTIDLSASLEEAIACGFKRILTSGGQNEVSIGMDTIFELMKQARERIIIMPGGGLRPEHLPPLYRSGKLLEVHASCKGWRKSAVTLTKTDLALTKNTNILTIDKEAVNGFVGEIDRL